MNQKGSPRFAPASTKVTLSASLRAVEAGQTGILILVGILILAAVAGGAYYLQSKEGSLHYTTTVIGGYPAREVHMSGECADGDQVVFIDKTNRIYEIDWPNCGGDANNSKKIAMFNQILSTFKFIK